MTHKLPFDLNAVVMMADVQQSGFWYGQSGLRVAGDKIEHYVLDYGPAASWKDLVELFERKYVGPGGVEYDVYQGMIDSGYIAKRTAGVYEFCLSQGGLWYPCQGRGVNNGLLAPVRETVFTHKGVDFEAVQFRDDLAKEELYVHRIKERSRPLYLPRDIDACLIEQWMNEKLVSRRTERGAEVLEWVDGGNNHLGDVFKIAMVCEWLLTDALLNPEGDEGGEKAESTDG